MNLLTLLASTTFAVGACDGAADDSSLEVAGFALTDDDESDDGFDESADTGEIEDELVDDLDEAADEEPLPDELDPVEPDGPGRVVRTVLVMWGQPRVDETLAQTPTVWSGTITSDVANVRIVRTVRFERGAQGDHLVRDQDPQSATFETTTTTHMDGLLLRVSVPRAAASLEGQLVFETGHFTQAVRLGALLAGQDQRFAADDLGNMLFVGSYLAHSCEHGLLRFGWQRVDRRGGVFGGKVFDDDGNEAGRVVGIWGTVAGKNRFKGVFRATDGSYRGTVRGGWFRNGDGTGAFRGMWTVGGRAHGVMGGVFQVGDTRGQGTAHGFWRASCEAEGDDCGATLPPADACVPADDPAPVE